jgi:hypothetical protein
MERIPGGVLIDQVWSNPKGSGGCDPRITAIYAQEMMLGLDGTLNQVIDFRTTGPEMQCESMAQIGYK